MTVNVKKMTVNVTFFLTLRMTEKDHCKRLQWFDLQKQGNYRFTVL